MVQSPFWGVDPTVKWGIRNFHFIYLFKLVYCFAFWQEKGPMNTFNNSGNEWSITFYGSWYIQNVTGIYFCQGIIHTGFGDLEQISSVGSGINLGLAWEAHRHHTAQRNLCRHILTLETTIQLNNAKCPEFEELLQSLLFMANNYQFASSANRFQECK